jgi:hypothetical protein
MFRYRFSASFTSTYKKKQKKEKKERKVAKIRELETLVFHSGISLHSVTISTKIERRGDKERRKKEEETKKVVCK